MSGSRQKDARSNGEYLLFVANLPFELNEDGIRKVFDEYGHVKAVMARKSGQFAFVSYSTYAEAENAIKSLDGQPPLYLSVQFGRKQQQKQSVENEVGSIGPEEFDMSNEEMLQDMQISKSEQTTAEGTINGSFPTVTNDSTSIDESRVQLLRSRLPVQNYYVYPAVSFPMIPVLWPYHPHYNGQQNKNMDSFWLNGFVTSDAAGRRYVTMGRGYVSYNLSDSKPKIVQNLGKVYEERQPDCYEYGIDHCKTSIGKCIHCYKIATLSCSVCEGFYCSRTCQINDWPNHQRHCMKIPPLVDAANNTQLDFQENSPDQPLMKNDIDETTAESLITNVNQIDPVENTIDFEKINSETYSEIENEKIVNLISTDQDQSIEINDGLSSEKNDVETESPIEQTEFVATCNDGEFLPESVSVQVLISAINQPGISYFVQKVDDTEKLEDLMGKLNENTEQLKKIDKPVVGKIYGILYDNIWHRGLVLSLNPTIVDYIDWGTIEELPAQLNDFRDIDELGEVPRFSQLIRVSKLKKFELNCAVFVKKIDAVIEDGITIINVDIMDEEIATDISVSQNFNSQVQHHTPNILRFMNVSMTIEGEIADILNAHTMTVVLLNFEAIAENFENLLTPMKNYCESIVSTYVHYKPRPHDWVAIKKFHDDYWFRGYVLKYEESLDTMLIASIDEGTLIDRVDKIIPLPPNYKNIEMFSVILKNELKNPLPAAMQSGSIVRLTVAAINKSDDNHEFVMSVDVTLENNDGIIEGLKLLPWKPWETYGDGTSAKIMSDDLSYCHESAVMDNNNTNNNDNNDHNHDHNSETNSSNNNNDNNNYIIKQDDHQVIGKKKIKHIELRDNSTVMLQSFRPPNIVYLRSLESEEIERHHQLIQKVAKCGSIAMPLNELPQPADYVLAKYIDGNYYRGLVISTNVCTQDIKVVYIDYGDIQVTTMDKLKIMPESLMDEPYCVNKVKLYGIKSVQPTEDVLEYLTNLMNNEEPLIYKFHTVIDSTTHVILKTVSSGDTVNDKINDLLIPSWQRDKKLIIPDGISAGIDMVSQEDGKIDCNEERIFVLNDIDLGKLGTSGETLSALLLETIEPGVRYVFGLEDNEMIMQLTRTMPQNMKKYAESSVHYIPRTNELCIALFDDNNWYRGCCINPVISSNSALVYFIDYGNTAVVEHSDIRKMTRDFLKPPAFGCICTTQDFINLPSNNDQLQKLLARLETLLLSNQAYQIEILNFDGEEYSIRLPEVNKKLSEEGLLPPLKL